jgi:hypothetical protein
MVFIPISVFAPVSNSHSEFNLQGLTQSRKTELRPFLANLGTRMRAHLCEYEADSLAEGLNDLFERVVEVPRIKQGRRQMLDTLISEEALLLAKYLRNERGDWIARIPTLQFIKNP